jgi:hypothetical protein
LAALIVCASNITAKTKTVRDATLAPLTMDLSDILHAPETSGLCTAVSLNYKDHRLPRLQWQRDIMDSEDNTDQVPQYAAERSFLLKIRSQ